MSTYVASRVDSLADRWQEVDILILEAAKERGNTALYNVLCRSTTLLVVAHLEGFMKDVAKDIIQDINSFSSFKSSPIFLKRTFCKQFIDTNSDTSIDPRMRKMIDVFDGLETKFAVDPFLVEGNYGTNKNPSPTVISKICSNFGVDNFFWLINGSRLDLVFSGTTSEVIELAKELHEHVSTGVSQFPYGTSPAIFRIVEKGNPSNKNRTIWETFLDNVLSHRHDIAHGSSFENSLAVEELQDFRNKVQILQYAIIIVLCNKIIPKL